ncbi:hypothetical protein KI387_013641, partial [Taxus chinensis]
RLSCIFLFCGLCSPLKRQTSSCGWKEGMTIIIQSIFHPIWSALTIKFQSLSVNIIIIFVVGVFNEQEIKRRKDS